MLIATFGQSTGWAGKTITHDGERFLLEGYGEVSAAGVLGYAEAGQVEWASAEMAAWVAAQATRAQHSPAVMGAQTANSSLGDLAGNLAGKLRESRLPLWAWGAIGGGILAVALLAVLLTGPLGDGKTDHLVAIVRADMPKADKILEMQMQASEAARQGDNATAQALFEQASAQQEPLSGRIKLKMRPEGKGALLYDAYAWYLFQLTEYRIDVMLEMAGGKAENDSFQLLTDMEATRRDVRQLLEEL